MPWKTFIFTEVASLDAGGYHEGSSADLADRANSTGHLS